MGKQNGQLMQNYTKYNVKNYTKGRPGVVVVDHILRKKSLFRFQF